MTPNEKHPRASAVASEGAPDAAVTTTTFGPSIDTLHLNLLGEMDPWFVGLLQEQKSQAIAQNLSGTEIAFPSLPGGDVWLSTSPPKATIANPRKYPYFFRNDLICAAVTHDRSLPPVVIRFHTRVLYQHDLNELEALGEEILRYFFVAPERVQVSRVDLAVDFQHPGFEIPDDKDVVGQTTVFRRDKDTRTGKNIFTVGSKSAQRRGQLYNKTAKINAEGQDFFHDIYEHQEGYDPNLPVFRMEFTYRRKFLSQLTLPGGHEPGKPGIQSISDLKDGLGDLAKKSVGDKDKGYTGAYLRFCPPETRGRDYRPAAPWWDAVADRFTRDLPDSGRIRLRPGSNPSFAYDLTMFLAYGARFAAHLKLEDTTSTVLLSEFPAEFQPHMEFRLTSKRSTWEKEVKKKLADIRNKQEG